MTPVTASSHHSPAAEPCFRRCIAVAPVTPNAPATPAITPNSPPRPPPQRPNRDRHRRSYVDNPDQRSPRPKPPPNQVPIDGKPPTQPPRVPSWGAFGRRPQHQWIGHDPPASETLHL